MWNSRDIALVILLAVAGLVHGILVVQVGMMITGIPGINYLVGSFGVTIWVALSFLLFKGRRWRTFLTVFIFILLTLPFFIMGIPYDVFARIPGILTIFFVDIIMNSFYSSYRKKNKLPRWSIITTLVFIIFDVILRTLTYPLFYSIDYVSTYLRVTLVLLPVVLIESAVGGYIGYLIYQRVKKTSK